MSKKKKHKTETDNSSFDPELLKMYMMGGANPGFSNKNVEGGDDVIDLHLEGKHLSKKNIPTHDALFYQLEELEKALDKAIAAGKLKLRVVHGLGKGKLKEEIFKLLEKHPQVKSYKNEYHSRYGFGSTVVYFY